MYFTCTSCSEMLPLCDKNTISLKYKIKTLFKECKSVETSTEKEELLKKN